MSYILEALKKLERKKQQEAARPALTLAEVPQGDARPRAVWISLITIGLVLNAAVLLWWVVFRGPYHPPKSAPAPPQRTLVQTPPGAETSPVAVPPRDYIRPESSDQGTTKTTQSTAPTQGKTPAVPAGNRPESVSDQAAPTHEERTPPPAAPPGKPAQPVTGQPPMQQPPATGSAPDRSADRPLPASGRMPTPASPPTTPKVRTAPDRSTPPPPAPDKKGAPSEPAPATPPQASKAPARPSNRVFPLNELPAEVRSALPPLKISTHVYSPEPSGRLVQVNEHMLSEGQDLPGGIKVEEILTRSVVFRFQGYRFRMELP